MPDQTTTAQRQRAALLAVRVGAVKDQLAALLVDVQREEPFFGSFHAVNGLRQAATFTNDCLVALMELAKQAEPAASGATTEARWVRLADTDVHYVNPSTGMTLCGERLTGDVRPVDAPGDWLCDRCDDLGAPDA